MEESLKCVFLELSPKDMEVIEGGDLGDVFEKINPVNLLEFVYQMGQDFGAASVKFGRECYDFYSDIKTIIN